MKSGKGYIHYISLAAQDIEQGLKTASLILKKTDTSNYKIQMLYNMSGVSVYQATENNTAGISNQELNDILHALEVQKELAALQWKQLEKFSMSRYNIIKSEDTRSIYTYMDEGDIPEPTSNRYLAIAY